MKYALRRLVRTPAFTIIAALSLAIGIGANTAAFGVLYAVLLRPLPVRDPGSLAVVKQQRGATSYSMSHPAYLYLRDHATTTLSDVIAFRDLSVTLSAGDTTDRVTGLLVSGNYFSALGIDPILGSSISPDDDRTPNSGGSRGPVALLSEQYWSDRFHRDPTVIGRAIRVEGAPITVVGIVPASFRGTRVGALPDVFMPMMFAPEVFHGPNILGGPYNHWLRIIVRKKPEVSFDRAEAELSVVFHQFNVEAVRAFGPTQPVPRYALQVVVVLESGRAGLQEARDRVSSPLAILMGLMALVWLIASINVAGLMVARAERYHRDTAIHLALGASTRQLWSQQLIESALLGAIGVAAGLVFATWMRGLLVQLVPARLELDLTLDHQVIGLALLLGVATTLVLGGMTGWHSTRRSIVPTLKGEDVAARLWLRKGLIVGQLALSIVVLVAAALFSQTLQNLRTADTGFEREHLLLASISPSAYPVERQRQFYAALLDSVRATPGVLSVAVSTDVPLDVRTGWTLRLPSDTGATTNVPVDVSFVSRDYFKTAGIPVIAGRPNVPAVATPTTTTASSAAPSYIVVNETFVRQYLPDRSGSPIGFRLIGNGTSTFEIIGVAKDSASRGFRERPDPLMYMPMEESGLQGNLVLYVRSAVPPASLAATIEALVHRRDPAVPIRDVRTIDEHVEQSIGRERTFARLSSSFGLLAALLAAIGLYGMLAYAVSRRTKELGIRLALGASPPRLVRMVLREAGALIALGLGLGVPLAFALGGTIRSLLYGVQPGDWRSLSIATIVLIGVGVLAAWLPARRAAGVDPLIALRHE